MITKVMGYELNRHYVEMFKDDKAYAVVFKGKMFIRPTFGEVVIVFDDLIKKILAENVVN